MNEQFTPGPWHAAEMGTDRTFWNALAADDVQIVRTNWDGVTGDVIAAVWSDDDSSDVANAHLISAAPDLLEIAELFASLEDPVSLGGGRRTPTKAECERARAAIAKARGQ